MKNNRVYILLILLTLAAWAAFSLIFGWICGLCVLAVCVLFDTVFTAYDISRKNKIRQLSADLNALLHGDSRITLDRYSEGELSVLQSEISKMTVTLNEQSHRLAEDKVFLADSIADISHQIRTPLTSINIVTSLLSEEDITEERRHELMRELDRLLARIDKLINILLKISKFDAGAITFKKEKISLEDMIRTAAQPMNAAMELKGQTLEIDAEGDFIGDIQWTGEALGNVIKNCWEHTPDGGRISVFARENALYSEVIISDNGSGISEEDLPNVFKRFYKGKNSGTDSFGIGLALAKMIVTGQGGAIKAGNSPDGGARFTVRFYKSTV